MADLTTGDLALMRDNGLDGGGFSFMWVFALLILMFGGGNMGLGNHGPAYPPNVATTDQVTNGFYNQSTQNQLQQIALSSANNNYETARLVNEQTNQLLQQNNTNLINAIQGFNQVNQNLMNQTNVLSQQIQAMASQLNDCCCSIKTQMLQDKYEATQSKLVTAENNISNYNQSQYLLGQFGRFVPWAGTGAPAATTAGT